MNNKYFIDSSLLINFFRRSTYSTDDKIAELIEAQAIYINGIIISEILGGSKRNETSITACIDFLNICIMDYDYFIMAGQMIKKIVGKTIPLSDIYIAQHCLDNNLILLANDKHFDMIKKIYPALKYEQTISEKR